MAEPSTTLLQVIRVNLNAPNINKMYMTGEKHAIWVLCSCVELTISHSDSHPSLRNEYQYYEGKGSDTITSEP